MACGPSGASSGVFTAQPPDGAFNPQRYIAKLSTSSTAQELGLKTKFLYDQVGFGTTVIPLIDNMYSIQFPAGSEIQETVQALGGSANIQFVEPDYIVSAFHTPNDPLFPNQWAHQTVQSPQAWDMSMGSKSVTIAVVDTGMDYTHPDLAANAWVNPGEIPNNGIDDEGDGYVDDVYGWNFAANSNAVMADDSPEYHGTHTAGIAGAVADNSVGVAGESPHVTLMPLKFLTANGTGNVSDAVNAIGFALNKKVQIISNSWGGQSFSAALCDAVSYAKVMGVLFVAAAGNGNAQGVGQDNDTTPTYPASCPADNMIAVASSSSSDQLSTFSNYGPTTVHLAAPGENILSTENGGLYQYLSGTSMATPLVAGAAALLMAARPDLNYAQIKAALLDNVDPIASMQGKTVTGGRLNVYKAMASIYQPLASPTPFPSPTPMPSPVPFPSPTPTPQPTPAGGIAPQPLLFGQMSYTLTNPQTPIPITYDLSVFGSQVAYAYLEVSKQDTLFADPNGTTPDPNRMLAAENPGATGSWSLTPSQYFPTWGTYYFRVIPLNSSQQPVGAFSNSSVLTLSPQ